MSITFAELQERFQQVWLDGRLLHASVTIAEADYESLEREMIPQKQWTAFERDLLGEERIAELDSHHNLGKITHVINYVNSSMVEVVRDPGQPSGSIILSEAEA